MHRFHSDTDCTNTGTFTGRAGARAADPSVDRVRDHLAHLYARYKDDLQPVCGALCATIGRWWGEADDLLQETLLRAAVDRSEKGLAIDSGEDLRPWLRTIARNTNTNHCRAVGRRTARELEHDRRKVRWRPDSTQGTSQADLLYDIEALLERHGNPLLREVVRLLADEVPLKRIAAVLGISRSSVRRLRDTARHILRPVQDA